LKAGHELRASQADSCGTGKLLALIDEVEMLAADHPARRVGISRSIARAWRTARLSTGPLRVVASGECGDAKQQPSRGS